MAAARPTISQLLEINERHQELRNENDRRQRETARLRDPRTISSARVVSSRLLQGVSKVIDNLDFSSINVLNASDTRSWLPHFSKTANLLQVILEKLYIVMWFPVKDRLSCTQHDAFHTLLSSEISRMSASAQMDVRFEVAKWGGVDLSRSGDCVCRRDKKTPNIFMVSLVGESMIVFWKEIVTKINRGVFENMEMMYRVFRDHLLSTTPRMGQGVKMTVNMGGTAMPFGYVHPMFSETLEKVMNHMFIGEGVSFRNMSIECRLTESVKRALAEERREAWIMFPAISCLFLPFGLLLLFTHAIPKTRSMAQFVALEEGRLHLSFDLTPVPEDNDAHDRMLLGIQSCSF